MNKKQYRHACRILRANGWDYTLRFFRNYPERIEVLKRVHSFYYAN